MASYNDLLTRVKGFLEDDYAEFETFFAAMVENAESRIARELNIDAMIQYATGTLTIGDRTLIRSALVRAVNRFEITVDGVIHTLYMRQPSFLSDYWPTITDTAIPKYFAIEDEATWVVAPTPDAAYAYKIETQERITGLSASTQNTWLSDEYPDLFFYGICLEGNVFEQDSEEATNFGTLYDRALASAIAEVERDRQDKNNQAAA